MEPYAVKPIGIIHSPFDDPRQTPIQAALAREAEGRVEIFEEHAEGLKDLEGFDRVWLIYWFDRAGPVSLRVVPFLDESERGLFATRAPCRPNPIGISAVRLLGVEGNVLHVADLDVLDGTPLLDIKPYSPRLDHLEARRSGWLDDARDDAVDERGRPLTGGPLPED
jgi:tRNA-Thr(GGU) m(6)t(6)A37 methyltransferase TsaA